MSLKSDISLEIFFTISAKPLTSSFFFLLTFSCLGSGLLGSACSLIFICASRLDCLTPMGCMSSSGISKPANILAGIKMAFLNVLHNNICTIQKLLIHCGGIDSLDQGGQ